MSIFFDTSSEITPIPSSPACYYLLSSIRKRREMMEFGTSVESEVEKESGLDELGLP
jgi:hypothetical protein